MHMDYMPRPQDGTGPTRRLIEARRLFAILPLIPPAFKRGQHLFKGGVYSRKYGNTRRYRYMHTVNLHGAPITYPLPFVLAGRTAIFTIILVAI